MRALELALVLGLGILICMPVLLLFCGSLADGLEWMERMEPMLLDNMEYIGWKWIPDYPTLENFKELLFLTPEFLKLFWNSVKIAVFILAGQLLVGTPSAWAFAAYDFKGKNILFSIYVILMLLPFQVTMLARYLVLNGLGCWTLMRLLFCLQYFPPFRYFSSIVGFAGFRRIYMRWPG